MSKKFDWTDGHRQEAYRLARTKTWTEVAAELTARWGHPFTAGGLERAVNRCKHLLEATTRPPVAVSPERDTIPMPCAAPYIPEEEPEEEETAETLAEEFAERSELTELRAAKKMLLTELASKSEQIAVLTELRRAHPLPPITRLNKVGGHQRQGVPVLVLSDLHVEERVDPEKVNGLNKYNPEIAERCLGEAFDGFQWLSQDSRFDCRTCVIAIIGDTFSGFIHDELKERNYMTPTMAVLWLQLRLERELRRFAKETDFERIVIVMKDGNHGRLTHKIRHATRSDNSLEWMMMQSIALRMADDPRFEFHVEEGHFTYLDVYDTALCFAHGDIWRSAGGVGGITIPLRKGFNEVKKRPHRLDHLILGHFHQRLDIGEIIVNGSMIGVTPYSLANCFPTEQRQQSWFLIDSEHGKCISAPVWLPQYDPSRD